MIDTDKECEYPVIYQYDPGKVSIVPDFITSILSLSPRGEEHKFLTRNQRKQTQRWALANARPT